MSSTLLESTLLLNSEVEGLIAEHMRRSREVIALKEKVLELVTKLEDDWENVQELRQRVSKLLDALGHKKIEDGEPN